MALPETSSPTPPAASAPTLAGETLARRVVWIDGLRGLAVLLVLLYHHWGFAGFPMLRLGPLDLGALMQNSLHGVHIFFVVSGFCLAWPFAGPQGRSLAKFSLPAYLKQRFTRLARPYYVVLLLSALPVLAATYVKTGLIPVQSWWDLLAHVFLMHNLNPDYVSSFNMALWTMALQFQFYLLFPLFLLLCARMGALRMLLLIGLLQLLYRVTVWFGDFSVWQLDYALAYAPPGRMFEFAAGMGLAFLIRDGTLILNTPFARWSSFLLAFGTGIFAYQLSSRFGRLHPAVDQLLALCVCALILLGFVPGLWRRLLESRLLLFCGACSYSIFLVHYPIGTWLHHHFYFEAHFPLSLRLLVMVAYVPLMIGAGWICYRLLEKPTPARTALPVLAPSTAS